MTAINPTPPRSRSNAVASRPVPAEEMLRAVEAVADYLTKHGVPNTALDLRLRVRDAWMEVLQVTPSTAYRECSEFTIVHQDEARGGHVFAYHGPTGIVFPAASGTDPSDVSWLRQLASGLSENS